jgi:chromosome segregation ATPase
MSGWNAAPRVDREKIELTDVLKRALAEVRRKLETAQRELNRKNQQRHSHNEMVRRLAEQRKELADKHRDELRELRASRDAAAKSVWELRRDNQKLRGELIAARDRITRLEQELAKVGG